MRTAFSRVITIGNNDALSNGVIIVAGNYCFFNAAVKLSRSVVKMKITLRTIRCTTRMRKLAFLPLLSRCRHSLVTRMHLPPPPALPPRKLLARRSSGRYRTTSFEQSCRALPKLCAASSSLSRKKSIVSALNVYIDVADVEFHVKRPAKGNYSTDKNDDASAMQKIISPGITKLHANCVTLTLIFQYKN